MPDQPLTWFYGDSNGRHRAARDLYERFCATLATAPDRAMAQLTAGIQSALAEAYAQGRNHDG